MGSISDSDLKACRPAIWEAAKGTALEFCVPWRLEVLRGAAFKGVRLMVDGKRYDANLGAPLSQQAWRWMQQEARRAANGLQQSELAGQLPKPSEAQVKDALDTFSVEEWRDLIERFSREDLDILRPYLYRRREELEQWVPVKKLRAILGADATRGLILGFERLIREGYEVTKVTDPYWVARITYLSRQRNRQLGTRPSVARSAAETGSTRAIALSLGISEYKVNVYRERMEQLPLESFDGDAHDYYFTIANTKAYKRYMRGVRDLSQESAQ